MKFTPFVARLSTLVALLSLASACPEETTEPKVEEQLNTTPLDAKEICGLYQAYYDNGNLCVQASVKSAADYDSAVLSRTCRPGSEGRVWAEDLLASHAAGRVKIDWGLAHKCIDESRNLRKSNPGYKLVQNKAWQDLRDGACTTFFAGITADGQACTQDWDCTADSTCASDTPFVGEPVCLKSAGVDQACSAYHGCAKGLYCGNGNTCLYQHEDGQSCDPNLSGDDCLSGSCNDNGSCDPSAAPLKEFGEACGDDEECGGDCAKCRPEAAGAASTCRLYGADGDYCRDQKDCLYDLGCVNNVCGTEPKDARCGSTVQALCDPGLDCIATENCANFADATSCNAHSPTCSFDTDYNTCSAVEGICTVSSDRPTSGACLYGYICADHYYCADGSCTALAALDGACSADGSTAPFCDSDLTCRNNVCVYPCEFNQDCASDQYCDEDGVCQAQVPAACTDSVQCPDNNYCNIPEDHCVGLEDATTCNATDGCTYAQTPVCDMASDCSAFTDATSCNAAPGCQFDSAGGSCVPACYFHDGDQSACEAFGGCVYDPGSAYCDPSCSTLTQSACEAEASCAYRIDEACEVVGGLVGTCDAQLAVGAACEDSDQCLSGDCADDGSGNTRCAVELSGCNRDTAYVLDVFLFGLLIVAGGRRRCQGR